MENKPDRPGEGWLSYLGYHVGKVNGLSKKKRRDILKEAFYKPIPIKAQFDENHVLWWGPAGSQERFEKLREWLSSSITERSGKSEMAEAVNDWTDDLLWLMSEFHQGSASCE